MVDAGVRMFSDDGRRVPDARILRNALVTPRRSAARWCWPTTPRTRRLADGGHMHEGAHSAALGLAGQAGRGRGDRRRARPRRRAGLRRAPPPVPSLSTARAVELVRRAKAEGTRVSAEVTPHHLTFTDADLRDLRHEPEDAPAAAHGRGSRGPPRRASPTARSTRSRPTTRRTPSRRRRWSSTVAPPGTIGLETALAVVLTELVASGPPHAAPRRGGDVHRPRHGSWAPPSTAARSQPGRPANLVLFDPEERWVVEAPVRLARAQQRVPRPDAHRTRRAPRSCAASRPSPTGSPPDERGPARPRGRHDLPRGAPSARPASRSARPCSTRRCPATRRSSPIPSYAGQIVVMTVAPPGELRR